MPFWTTQRILHELQGPQSPILTPDEKQVKTACYEMSLGHETFITSVGSARQILEDQDQIQIPPGQFALLVTKEEVHLPRNVLAFISIKASMKMRGLVNVSGFHVDPGFEGRLKYSVYNAGSETIVLEVGKPLFPIWFCELPEGNVDDYNGAHKRQSGITPEDVMQMQGELASPASLKKEIDELRSTVGNWKAATIGTLAAAVAAAVAAFLTKLH